MGHGSASCPGQAPHLVGPAASQRGIAVREKRPQIIDFYKKIWKNQKINDFFEIRSWQIEKSFVKEALHTVLSPVESR